MIKKGKGRYKRIKNKNEENKEIISLKDGCSFIKTIGINTFIDELETADEKDNYHSLPSQ